jgi:hypothetical protein
MLLVKGFGNDVYLFPFPSMNITTLSVCPPKTCCVTIEVSKDFEKPESNSSSGYCGSRSVWTGSVIATVWWVDPLKLDHKIQTIEATFDASSILNSFKIQNKYSKNSFRIDSKYFSHSSYIDIEISIRPQCGN